MKQNEKITQLLSAVLSSSILFSSCEGELLLQPEGMDYKREFFSKNTSTVILPFDLNNYLSDAESDMVNNAYALAHEITTNPQSALSFSQNPSVLLEKYRLQGTIIETDSISIMILKTLCSPEALQTLKNEDYASYLNLLRENGLPIDSIIQNIKKLSEAKLSNTRSVIKKEPDPQVGFFPIPVAAVAFLYVAAATIVVVEVAAGAHFALSVWGPDPTIMPNRSVAESGIENSDSFNQALKSIGLTQEEFNNIIDMAKQIALEKK